MSVEHTSNRLNDYNHCMQEPWQTVAKVRDDLRQARAILRTIPPLPLKPEFSPLTKVRDLVERALNRIGDGTREADHGR